MWRATACRALLLVLLLSVCGASARASARMSSEGRTLPTEDRKTYLLGVANEAHVAPYLKTWYTARMYQIMSNGVMNGITLYTGLFSRQQVTGMAVDPVTENSYAVVAGPTLSSSWVTELCVANLQVGVPTCRAVNNTSRDLVWVSSVNALAVLELEPVEGQVEARLVMMTRNGRDAELIASTTLPGISKVPRLVDFSARPHVTGEVVSLMDPGGGELIQWTVNMSNKTQATQTASLAEPSVIVEWLLYDPTTSTSIVYANDTAAHSTYFAQLALHDGKVVLTSFGAPLAIPLPDSLAVLDTSSGVINAVSEDVLFTFDLITGDMKDTIPLSDSSYHFVDLLLLVEQSPSLTRKG